MRRILLLLALATMLLVIMATAAHADYWPPDLTPHLHIPVVPKGH